MENEHLDDTCNAVVTINGRGPIRIEGKFEITDTKGTKFIVDNDTIKICGCGKSAKMPLCDGSHKK